MEKAKINFKRERDFKVTQIDDVKSGEFFVLAYHNPHMVMNGDELANVYVKLPKSTRTIGDLLDKFQSMESVRKPACYSEQKNINEGRVAFNVREGKTRCFDAGEPVFIVKVTMNVEFT